MEPAVFLGASRAAEVVEEQGGEILQSRAAIEKQRLAEIRGKARPAWAFW
jgi:hypothetical protein